MAPPTREGPRVNEMINVPEVRLIDHNGENVGVVGIENALERAEQVELDLVELSPNANPPVCKILDFGKYKYEAQKKANVARKKQKTVEVKEIKMRPGIEMHDYDGGEAEPMIVSLNGLLQMLECPGYAHCWV